MTVRKTYRGPAGKINGATCRGVACLRTRFLSEWKMVTGAILILCLAAAFACPAPAARIKDIAVIAGVRDNQLIGYGLVVGLDGTGDKIDNGFTDQALTNMLSRQGLSMRGKSLESDNVAAVMLTAALPPFVKQGSRIDVMVSSIGDAESLLGGTLLMSPLRGADGRVYAVAQGSVIIGGFSVGGAGGGVSKNHATVGRIPNGASVERELSYDFAARREFTINLHAADFTTCRNMEQIINQSISGVTARVVDASSVTVAMNGGYPGDIIDLVSSVEGLDVSVDTPAVVVLNEKTGTIVMGENVRISTVAIAHGNLSIQIKEEQSVSQPLPFSPEAPAGSAPTELESGAVVAPGGQTVVTTDTSIGVTEEKKQMQVVPAGVTIREVVAALNAIGATPRDLIVILQTIKAAGALQAELEIL